MAWITLSAELESDRDIVAAVDTVALGCMGIIGRAALAGAQILQGAISENAPWLTGELAQNITVKSIQTAPGKVTVLVGPAKEQFYGRFQELGTSKAPAQPFMLPAYRQYRTKARKKIIEVALEGFGL